MTNKTNTNEKDLRIVGAFGYKENKKNYNGLDYGEFLGDIKTDMTQEDLIKVLHERTKHKFKVIQICELNGKPNFTRALNI